MVGSRNTDRLGNCRLNEASGSASHSDATSSFYNMGSHQNGVGYSLDIDHVYLPLAGQEDVHRR